MSLLWSFENKKPNKQKNRPPKPVSHVFPAWDSEYQLPVQWSGPLTLPWEYRGSGVMLAAPALLLLPESLLGQIRVVLEDTVLYCVDVCTKAIPNSGVMTTKIHYVHPWDNPTKCSSVTVLSGILENSPVSPVFLIGIELQQSQKRGHHLEFEVVTWQPAGQSYPQAVCCWECLDFIKEIKVLPTLRKLGDFTRHSVAGNSEPWFPSGDN